MSNQVLTPQPMLNNKLLSVVTHSYNPSSSFGRHNPGDSLTASLRTEIFCLHTYRRNLYFAPNLFCPFGCFSGGFALFFSFFLLLFYIYFLMLGLSCFTLKDIYYLCIYYKWSLLRHNSSIHNLLRVFINVWILAKVFSTVVDNVA